MIRVLHIVSVLRRGGVETMLMNFYRNINRDEVQFDFIAHGSEIGDYEPEIKSMGGFVFHVRTKSESFFGNLKDIRTIVSENKYRIVEVHQDAMSVFALKAAKQGGAPIRIAHAHSTSMPPSKFGKLIYPYAIKRTTKYANVKFSCSKKSAEYLYNGDVADTEYIYNGIDIEKFAFSKFEREKQRAMYSLNSFILAQVGNFMYPKNQHFTLLVFRELLKLRPDARLFFCGSGVDLEIIREVAVEMGVDKAIIFAGSIGNMHQMLSAFDAVIMPSFYEGFPVSLIEAQCAGLPCVVSDTITRETEITDLICYKSLNEAPALWAKEICDKTVKNRESYAQKVRDAGFDVMEIAKKLQNRYCDLSRMINDKG